MLCITYCVLCIVYYVLCIVYCVLCIVYCVLCFVFCFLFFCFLSFSHHFTTHNHNTIAPASFFCFRTSPSITPLPTQDRFLSFKNSNLVPWRWNLITPLNEKGAEKKTDFFALISDFLEGGIHPDAGQLLSRVKATPFSDFFLHFGVEDVSVSTSPPSLSHSSLSFSSSPYLSPILPSVPDDSSFSPLRVELKMGCCGCFEQWTGAISKIPLGGGIVKRKIAREIVQIMAQMGKGYEEARELVKGLFLFIFQSFWSPTLSFFFLH